MIVAVGSDKGSPGATTLAVVLAMVWPGPALVCELDPRGADLPYRLAHADGQPMRPSPSLASLAVGARPGAPTLSLDSYAQPTVLNVAVIPGEVSPHRNTRLAPHLPNIAAVAAQWPGTVIADLGSLQPGNPAMVIAKAATVLLLVTRANVEGLGHLRDRIDELAAFVGDPLRTRTSVGVVVVAEARDEKAAVDRTGKLLASIGSPAPVVGAFRHDPAAAAALWSGPATKKTLSGPLIRSVDAIVRQLLHLWPELAEPAAPALSGPPAQQADLDGAALSSGARR